MKNKQSEISAAASLMRRNHLKTMTKEQRKEMMRPVWEASVKARKSKNDLSTVEPEETIDLKNVH